MKTYKEQKRTRRHRRIRARVSGTSDRPRLAVSKSNKNIVAQIIDDDKGETLAHAWTKSVKGATLRERAIEVGKKIATDAIAKKIKKVVFDRGGFAYAGNIKSLAEAAREAGLEF